MKRGRFEYIETMVGKPPEGWTLDTTVLRETEEDIMCEVECWRRGAFAVHEVDVLANNAAGVPVRREKLGRLSHKRTGLRIIDCTSVDDAVLAAELIEKVIVWDDIKVRADANQPGLWPKVKEKLEKLFVEDRDIAHWMTVFRPREEARAS